MALVLADRVQETSTSTGTGSFTLAGAVTGYQSFAVIGNGNTTFYTIADQGGANWEVGIGTYTSSGTSLSRDTVLASSNSGSLVNFTSGTKTVFVTYPSEKSVNLNAAGNVSALGTISSGTWQGTTVGVAYGGTGVTASSGANSVVLRDSNQNISVNSVTQNLTKTVSAGGTTVLTLASSHFQVLTGTLAQTYQLPDATSLPTGSTWIFDNDSTQNLTIVDNASGTVDVVAPGGYTTVFLEANGTVAGEWGRFGMLPNEVNWGTNSLDLGGSTVVTNGVWQGTAVAPGYGGTGLTTFSGANNALYSTGASTLTAGTLPVAAGGTGVTSATANGVIYGNGTSALQVTAAGTTGQVLLGNTGSAPSWGSVPASSITGTLPIANGGTGQTTASAAFNALSPITTTGDLILGNGANSATRLGIGSSGQVLTVSGGTASWVTPSTGGGTITTTDFTATAGQTTFTVSYTVGLVEVYQNGAKLGVADFTATTGTSIVLATGAAAGDLIEVVAFSSLNLYSTITYDDFSGDGTTTVFTMSAVPANSASLLVAISGVVQDPGTYTVSSTTLTFLTAPPAGSSNISVRYLGVASVGTVGSFSGGTTGLTPSSATTGAVVLGGTLNVANGGTGLTTLASGRIPYGAGTSALASASTFVFDGTNLGIGTTSPTTQKLHISGLSVSGPTNNPAGIRITDTLTSEDIQLVNRSGNMLYNVATGNNYSWQINSTEVVTIDSSGNVGIGTSSPSDKLQVTGGYARIDNSGSSALRLYNSTTQVAGIGLQGWSGLGSANDLTVGTVSSNNTIFMTGLTERMRISSAGYVGINTATPQEYLNIDRGSGTNNGILRFDSGGTNTFRGLVGIAGAANQVFTGTVANDMTLRGDQELFIGTGAATNTRFLTNGTERMRIDSSGNVQLSTAGTSILNSSGRKMLNQTGGVLQVVSTTLNTTFSTTSATYTAVTGLSVTITPSSTSSKIMVTGAIALAPPSGASSSIQLQRSGTVINQGAASGSQPQGFAAVEGSLYSSTSEALNYLDAPATTSAITYQIYMQVSGGTGYINRTYNNRSSTAYDAVTASTITVMEIAG